MHILDYIDERNAKMAIDKEYPGDSRMEPVDVDVLDNLINAQAAYLDAMTKAAEHVKLNPDSTPGEEMTEAILKVFSMVSGSIMSTMAIDRL